MVVRRGEAGGRAHWTEGLSVIQHNMSAARKCRQAQADAGAGAATAPRPTGRPALTCSMLCSDSVSEGPVGSMFSFRTCKRGKSVWGGGGTPGVKGRGGTDIRGRQAGSLPENPLSTH